MADGSSGIMPIAGTITGFTIPWLFQGLHGRKTTGSLVVAREHTVKKAYFSQGEVVFASSNLRDDWLGVLLLRTGAITQEQFDRSSEIVLKSGRRQGRVLVELEILSPQDLVAGVKAQVRQILTSLLAWRDGYYIFDEGPLPDYDIIPLQMSIGNLIIEGLREAGGDPVLPSRNAVVRHVADPALLFQGADLDPIQRMIFSLIDGKKSIEELCCSANVGVQTAQKALSVLVALRMVEAGEIRAAGEAPFVCGTAVGQGPVPEPGKAVAGPPPKPEAPVIESLAETLAWDDRDSANAGASSLTREEVQEAYEGLKRRNQYEILGVAPDSTEPEIKRAYFHRAKRFHPDQHFGPLMSEMRGKLEALTKAFAEAYATLSNADTRGQYDRDLASGAHRRTGPAEPAAAPVRRKSAIDCFEEGLQRYKEQEFPAAEEMFQAAAALDPMNAQFLFYRGLALSRMPRRGREAEEFFVRATALAPANVTYALELGSFYSKYGLKAKAVAVFQDALKYNPKSEKIKEALKQARA